MKELCKKGMVFLLSIASAIFLVAALPIENIDYPGTVAACAVPIPESKPGEEKQDAFKATIGLGVLLVAVGGGLIYLQIRNKQET